MILEDIPSPMEDVLSPMEDLSSPSEDIPSPGEDMEGEEDIEQPLPSKSSDGDDGGCSLAGSGSEEIYGLLLMGLLLLLRRRQGGQKGI